MVEGGGVLGEGVKDIAIHPPHYIRKNGGTPVFLSACCIFPDVLYIALA